MPAALSALLRAAGLYPAGRESPLPAAALETIHRLAVLEQINRRDGAQTKLRSEHLLGVAVQLARIN
jgi:hypothetical protein